MDREDKALDDKPKKVVSVLSEEEARKIIKAAGHKSSSEELQQLIQSEGHQANQLDGMAESRKSPLHHACWKGSLSSIQYLLEQVGCDANVHSKQTFSYGKTAIFFALTQSRREVVRYLLSRAEVNVSIVNNKGQSVLSLAASHNMPMEMLQTIQSKEESDLTKWWNFRETHSDNLEYGDLDPRFLDRPLRDTDVVTEYAVNPTTKKSRKGAFERRNPEAAKEWQRHRQQKNQGNKTQTKRELASRNTLSAVQQKAIDGAWTAMADQSNSDRDLLEAIITIMEQSDGLRKPWLADMADRLLEMGYDYNQVSRLSLSLSGSGLDEDPMTRSNSNGRTTSLFLKLLTKLQGDGNSEGQNDKPSNSSMKSKVTKAKEKAAQSTVSFIDSESFKEWSKMASELQHLSISSLEQTTSTGGIEHLALNDTISSITFLNDYNGLLTLWNRLEAFANSDTNSLILAMDSEWTASDSGSPILSTLQLAFCDPILKEISVSVYILDLLVGLESKDDDSVKYQSLAQKLVHWMIYGNSSGSTMLLLGFSIGHDLRILRDFCNPSPKGMPPHANKFKRQIFDIQLLLMARRKSVLPSKQLPGLKTCTKLFSSFELSKEEQRSDWSKRPLSQSQVQYAALDAAILLFLLAEEYRSDNSG